MKLQFLEDTVSDDEENAEQAVYIEYHYEYDFEATTEKSWIPYGMVMDKGTKARDNYILLWGTDFDAGAATTDKASVMRMSLSGGTVDWSFVFSDAETMADITQQTGQDIIHGCGYNSIGSIVYRLDTYRGDLKWINEIGHGASTDRCRGITSWEDTRTEDDLIVAVFETDGGANFGGKDTGFKDAFLVVFDLSGDAIRSVQLSLSSADITIADGSLMRWGNTFYFAGEATGFSTLLQSTTFTDTMSNGLVFKYEFDHPASYQCVYEWDASAGYIRNSITSAVGNNNYEKNPSMDMENKVKVFIAYQSPYSGGFELKDSFSIPRPCASTSINMTEVSYFYGQREYEFDLSAEPGAQGAFSKMQTPLFTH